MVYLSVMKIRLSELRKLIREEVELRPALTPDEGFVAKTLPAEPVGDVDVVNYGNPPLEFHKIAKNTEDFIKNWFINHGLVDEICRSAPANDSETTREDLNILLELVNSATSEDITFARYVDDLSNLAQTFIDLLSEKGHEEDMGRFFEIETQNEGLLYHLKDIINRPRPYQLAKSYGLALYPLMRTDAMSASYPGGHAMAGFMMSEYYARKYPDAAIELYALGDKIARSRELVGIHYPSDTAISKEIVKIIIDNGLIRE